MESKNCRAILAIDLFPHHFSPRFNSLHIQSAVTRLWLALAARGHMMPQEAISAMAGLSAWLGACMTGADAADTNYTFRYEDVETELGLLYLGPGIYKIFVRVKIAGKRDLALSDLLTKSFNLIFGDAAT